MVFSNIFRASEMKKNRRDFHKFPSASEEFLAKTERSLFIAMGKAKKHKAKALAKEQFSEKSTACTAKYNQMFTDKPCDFPLTPLKAPFRDSKHFAATEKHVNDATPAR